MTASSGIIVLNSRNNTRRIVRFQNSIETKKSNFAIQLNRIDAVGFSIYSSTESIARKYDFYFMINWTLCENQSYFEF